MRLTANESAKRIERSEVAGERDEFVDVDGAVTVAVEALTEEAHVLRPLLLEFVFKCCLELFPAYLKCLNSSIRLLFYCISLSKKKNRDKIVSNMIF